MSRRTSLCFGLGALIIVDGPTRHKIDNTVHEAGTRLVSRRHFTIRNECALTLVVLRRDVDRGGSNQRSFEQVGGNQVSFECLGQATNNICGRLLIVIIVAGSRSRLLRPGETQIALAVAPTRTQHPAIPNFSIMSSSLGSGSIYNGPEKIVIGIDLGTTMSCVRVSRTVSDRSSIVLLF